MHVSERGMKSEWITTAQAAKILGLTTGTIRRRASAEEWPIGRRKREPPSSGPDLWIYRRSDVEAYADERAHGRVEKRMARLNCGEDVRKLVKWANGLMKWPTEKQILKRVTDVFRVPDIELVIEARYYRELPMLREPQRIKPRVALRLV